jgi:hypothetical protein
MIDTADTKTVNNDGLLYAHILHKQSINKRQEEYYKNLYFQSEVVRSKLKFYLSSEANPIR